jgi:single-strand DNA-binding protein
MNVNKVFIAGRVTADLQLRTTAGGMSVVSFGVATNRTWTKDGKKQEEVEFHNVVIFGKQAEIAVQYLKRGSLVHIEGRLRTRNWTDKDGHDRRSTEIISENMQLGPSAAGGVANPQPPVPAKKELAEEEIVPIDGDEEDTGRNFQNAFEDDEIKPEDIPF